MHGLMIAIEYSYKLDRKNYFNLWCELGRLLLRQSHMTYIYDAIWHKICMFILWCTVEPLYITDTLGPDI